LKRLWQFRNDIYNQDNEGTTARYKLEALEIDMEKVWTRHTELLPKLWDFQKQHFDRRQRIADLRYESKKCWATLAKLYLDDAENNRSGSHSEIEQTNGWRTGAG
jgi:enoyl reductase-like protein